MKNERKRVYSFRALAFDTACGALVVVFALAAIIHENPVKWVNWPDRPWDVLNGVDWTHFRGYALYPAMVGGLAGAAIGGAVRVTQVGRCVPALCLVLAWGLLGGVIAVLLPIGAMVFYPSVFGSVGRDGSGGGGVFLIMLLSALVAFAIGSIAGTVIGVIKARTQNPKPRANAAGREAAPGHGGK